MPILPTLLASTPNTALHSGIRTLSDTLHARDGFKLPSSSSSGIKVSKNAIIYIVCLGAIPVILVTCIVIWALYFYGRNRARCCCCCCCRKRKNNKGLLRKDRDSGSDVSEDIMMREFSAQIRRPPTRQGARTLVVVREDSELSIPSDQGGERSPSLRRFV